MRRKSGCYWSFTRKNLSEQLLHKAHGHMSSLFLRSCDIQSNQTPLHQNHRKLVWISDQANWEVYHLKINSGGLPLGSVGGYRARYVDSKARITSPGEITWHSPASAFPLLNYSSSVGGKHLLGSAKEAPLVNWPVAPSRRWVSVLIQEFTPSQW